MLKFLFVHGWDGFSLAELCLREALNEQEHNLDFLSIELKENSIASQDEFFRALSLIKPDFVGFSCFFWNLDYFLTILKDVKAILPECKIVLGGPQINSINSCNDILSQGNGVDYIIRGDAEISLPLLIEKHHKAENLNQIDGLSYRDANGIIHVPEGIPQGMDRPEIFHWGNFELTEMISHQNVVSYETLRGCRFNCSYCKYPNKGLKMLDLKMVVRELAYLCDLRIPNIRICDAHFGGTKSRAKAILKRLADINHSSSIKIYVDLSHIDREYLELAQSAGVEITSIGIQSTNKQALKRVRRPQIHRFKNKIEMILDMFPETPADLILGLPGDNLNGLRKTFKDVIDLGFHKFNLFTLAVYPGTELTESSEFTLETAKVSGFGEQVLLSEFFPDVEKVSKYVVAMNILSLMREVRERFASISHSEIFDYLIKIESRDLFDLYRIIFNSGPESLLIHWESVINIFRRLSGWKLQYDEALACDLLFEQYRNCLHRDIEEFRMFVEGRLQSYTNVVYKFSNDRIVLWDLKNRGFYLNPGPEVINESKQQRTWVIDSNMTKTVFREAAVS